MAVHSTVIFLRSAAFTNAHTENITAPPRQMDVCLLFILSFHPGAISACASFEHRASHSSSAAIMAITPATFSVPDRRPASCSPPKIRGRMGPLEGHFKKPTPFGPPNLCAHPLTQSHWPIPREGILPI